MRPSRSPNVGFVYGDDLFANKIFERSEGVLCVIHVAKGRRSMVDGQQG